MKYLERKKTRKLDVNNCTSKRNYIHIELYIYIQIQFITEANPSVYAVFLPPLYIICGRNANVIFASELIKWRFRENFIKYSWMLKMRSAHFDVLQQTQMDFHTGCKPWISTIGYAEMAASVVYLCLSPIPSMLSPYVYI